MGRLVVGMDAALEEEREAARQGSRGEARRWRKDQKEQVDELLPKATGRCVVAATLKLPLSYPEAEFQVLVG